MLGPGNGYHGCHDQGQLEGEFVHFVIQFNFIYP